MTTNEPRVTAHEPAVAVSPNWLRDQYCSLLQRTLTRYEMDAEISYVQVQALGHSIIRPTIQGLQRLLRRRQYVIMRFVTPGAVMRSEGRDWPANAETMVGMKRLDNLRECLEQVFADRVPGDVLEAGVWRGGASIFMRGVLRAYGESHRQSWVADSFAGLPETEPERYPYDKGLDLSMYDELGVSLETVKANFEKYGLLDESVHFLQGWFEDTLPAAPVDRLALLRLDGDLYSSTIQTLDALYDKVTVGGFIVVDDYAIPACKQATHDFRQRRGIEDPIEAIDWTGVYWRKSGDEPSDVAPRSSLSG